MHRVHPMDIYDRFVFDLHSCAYKLNQHFLHFYENNYQYLFNKTII